MFIIDFDDTLFNTQAFKEARQKALKDLGVSEELYKKSYQEAYNNSLGINTYNNSKHAEILERYGFDKQAVAKSLDGLSIIIKDLLFPDAISFLESLKKYNQKLILLSLGEPNFQKMKIDNAEVAKYFTEVFTVDDTKEHIIDKILKEYPNEKEVWLVNDKVEETKKIIQHFPQLKPILKMSPRFSEEEYKKSLMPYFSTLTLMQQYVQQQLE